MFVVPRVLALFMLCSFLALAVTPAARANFGAAERAGATHMNAAGEPRVLADTAGNLVGVWLRVDGPTPLLVAATKRLGGTWSSETTLTSARINGFDVARDAGNNVTVVWDEEVPDGSGGTKWGVRVRTLAAGSTSWGAAQALFPGSRNATDPAIAAGADGTAVVVLVNGGLLPSGVMATGSMEIEGAYRSTLAGAWELGGVSTIAADDDRESSPDVAVNAAGKAVAAWVHDDPDGQIIQSGTLDQPWVFWTPPTDITTPAAGAATQHEPIVAVSFDGSAHVAWLYQHGPTGPGDPRLWDVRAVSRATSDPFPPATDAQVIGSSLVDGLLDFPTIDLTAVGNSGAAVVWNRDADPGLAHAIVAATRTSAAGSWNLQELTPLATGETWSVPKLASAGSGTIMAVWNARAGSTAAGVRAALATGGNWSAMANVSTSGHNYSSAPTVDLAASTWGAVIWNGPPVGAGPLSDVQVTPWGTFPGFIAPDPTPQHDTVITRTAVFTPPSRLARFEFESRPAGGSFQCRIDGGEFRACTSPASFDDLAYGGHLFEVRAVGSNGLPDTSPAESRFATLHACQYLDMSDSELTRKFVGNELYTAVRTIQANRACSWEYERVGTSTDVDVPTVRSAVLAVNVGSDGTRYPLVRLKYVEPDSLDPKADADGDGLLNGWETKGYDHDADGKVDVDLPAMGANPRHKDMFIELDQMAEHPLSADALAKVVTSFAASPVTNPDNKAGISLHIDAGADSPMKPGATWGTRSRSSTIPYQKVFGAYVTVPGSAASDYSWSAMDTTKAKFFDKARAPIFRYAVSVARYGSATEDSAGLARGIPGSDIIVALGRVDAKTKQPANLFGVMVQAGTFMHELGHTMNLRHGGNDDVHYKPNYLSIMNYSFIHIGLSKEDQAFGILDFSRWAPSTFGTLDEGRLVETAGLPSTLKGWMSVRQCPTGRYPIYFNQSIDWNCDGRESPGTVSFDFGGDGQQQLSGYDDWANISFKGGNVGRGRGVAIPPEEVAARTPSDEASVTKLLADARQLLGDKAAPKLAVPKLPKVVRIARYGLPLTVRYVATDDLDIDAVSVTIRRAGYTVKAPGRRSGVGVLRAKVTTSGTYVLTAFAIDSTGARSKPVTTRVKVIVPPNPKPKPMRGQPRR